MWPVCSDANMLWGLLPLLIGLIIGWWAWARRGAATSDAATSDVVTDAVTPDAVSDIDPDGGAAIGASAAMVAPVTLAKVNAPDRLPQAAPEPVAPPLPKISAEVATGDAPAVTAIGVPAASGPADDLRKIKGVGPKLNTLLISLGITRFDQIAAWSADDIEKVDAHLGTFKNRISRDSWVEQANLLAKGLISEFEAKFGKLDSENR